MKLNEKLLRELPEQTEKYIHTRFNIEAGYRWGSGMPMDKMNAFYDEIKDLFAAAGWTVKGGCPPTVAPTVYYESSSLYCHPMELSGPCEEKLYPIVSAILNQATTCSLQSIEKLGQVYKLSDHEYENALHSIRKDIEKDLLNAFKTTHPMEFISGYYNNLSTVAEQYRVPTLKSYIGLSSNDVQVKYITQVFNDMIKDGKILCKENNHGYKSYRSTTGAERLEQARKEAAKQSSVQVTQTKQEPHQSQSL